MHYICNRLYGCKHRDKYFCKNVTSLMVSAAATQKKCLQLKWWKKFTKFYTKPFNTSAAVSDIFALFFIMVNFCNPFSWLFYSVLVDILLSILRSSYSVWK